MLTRRHLVAATAALALGAGGILAASPSTAAAAAITCAPPRQVTGSAGHKGVALTCGGGAFTGWVDCKKGGLIYTHYGNRAVSGGTSTTWCDLQGDPVGWGLVTS
ncbi:hypothetical protein [Streptomyces sp. NPDC051569]|uniref:hypothetical protein n=1 Tax=Streptomyces sp. NPDC051569 TaxID=3365661 RepID=UPI0037BA3AFA